MKTAFKFESKLICKNCDSQYDQNQIISICKKCEPAKSHLKFDFSLLESAKNLIRSHIEKNTKNPIHLKYGPLLPFNLLEKGIFLPEITMTPFYRSHQLSQLANVSNVWIKDETRNLTGSIKDRASYLGVIAAKWIHKADLVATASTGNQAISLAAYAAAAELDSVVFVSKNISPNKVNILTQYGAQIVKVPGTYDDAYDACLKITEKNGWINKSAGLSPICLEGMKTVAYEISEQTAWNPPQTVFVPVGDGTVYSSLAKGFVEFFKLGLIPRIPKIIGVQSSQCNSVVMKFQNNKRGCTGQSIAESISVGTPRDLEKLSEAVETVSGNIIDVDDKDIQEMQLFFSKKNGIYLELASSSVLAGLIQAKKMGLCHSDDSPLLVLTGTGFKEERKAV